MSGGFDDATVRTLNALTSDFYAREAASFSATRQAPWQGWDRALSLISETDPRFATRPLNVLDLGCGNLRFERFLSERVHAPLSVCAVDNCPPLVEGASDRPSALPPAEDFSLSFHQIDLVDRLLGRTLCDALPAGTSNLAVAFGIMHHLPRFDLRAQMLACLGRSLRPGGFAVVSFWRFLDDPRLAAKAESTTAEGRIACDLPPFDPRDALLPWQHAESVYRFCHHCNDEEIDQLIATAQLEVPLTELARFSADGKSGTLNRYLVLQCAL